MGDDILDSTALRNVIAKGGFVAIRLRLETDATRRE